jgi:hypothetical protein
MDLLVYVVISIVFAVVIVTCTSSELKLKISIPRPIQDIDPLIACGVAFFWPLTLPCGLFVGIVWFISNAIINQLNNQK